MSLKTSCRVRAQSQRTTYCFIPFIQNVQSTGKGREIHSCLGPRQLAGKESGCSWGWGFFWDEWKYSNIDSDQGHVTLHTLTAPELNPWCRAFLVKGVAWQLMTVMISWVYSYLKWYKTVQFKYVQFMAYLLHPIKLFLKITYSEHLEISTLHSVLIIGRYSSNLFSMNAVYFTKWDKPALSPFGNVSWSSFHIIKSLGNIWWPHSLLRSIMQKIFCYLFIFFLVVRGLHCCVRASSSRDARIRA